MKVNVTITYTRDITVHVKTGLRGEKLNDAIIDAIDAKVSTPKGFEWSATNAFDKDGEEILAID